MKTVEAQEIVYMLPIRLLIKRLEPEDWAQKTLLKFDQFGI